MTAYPTSNNQATGSALFNTIFNVQSCALVNTNTANSVVVTGIRSVSTDLRTIIINCVQGNQIAVGGSSMVAATNGATITVLAYGT